MNNPNSFTSAIFKPMLEWFYENQSRVNVVFEVSDPECTSTPPIPQGSISDATLANQDHAPIGEIKYITINLGPDAISKFEYFQEGFSFTVRFNQVATVIYVPYNAVMSLQNPDQGGKSWQADFIPSIMRGAKVEEVKKPVEQEPAKIARPNFLQRVK